MRRALIPALALLCGLVGAAGAYAGAEPTPGEPEAVPVLGSKNFAEIYGAGFGHAEPEVIFNGGDPSGEVSEIHWKSWGGVNAIGWGRNPVFKPGGGAHRK